MEDIKVILKSVEDLFDLANFKDALKKVRAIDVSNLTPSQMAYYNLLLSQAMLFNGDNNVKDYLLSSLQYYDHSKDDLLYAKSKYTYGWFLAISGNFDEARQVLIESYVLFKRYDDLQQMSNALNWLAFVNNHSGAVDNAISNLKECINISNKLGNEYNVIAFSRNLATAFTRSGLINKAILHLKTIKDKLMQMDVNVACRFNYGDALAHALLGDTKHAIQLMDEVKRLTSLTDRNRALYHEYLGWIYNLDNRFEEAVKTLKQGIALSSRIAPESALISQSKRLLADACLGLKKTDPAEKAALEALEIAEKIRERSEMAACYRVFARVEQARGNHKKAKKRFDDAVNIFRNIGSRYELAVTRYLAAVSGLYESGERAALLYLAKEYFLAENIEHYVERTDRELNRFRQMTVASSVPDDPPPVFIAHDKKMKQLVKLAENVAPSAMTVFLTGPTGTGKDQLARYIHYRSGRGGKFVIVNSAAIPDSMVEAELFGFRKGAFTGAESNRKGLFEEADGGTFYLNEIADASQEFQAKLLEVIETRMIRPLGTNNRKPVDIRIIAATNNELEEKMKSGRFRRDLYHRLNEIPVVLPSLSDRADDIPALVEHFMKSRGHNLDRESDRIILDTIAGALRNQTWPGNVRQLKAEINRLYLLGEGDMSTIARLVSETNGGERDQLVRALEKSGWNRRETARILGISEGAVRYKIKKYDIKQVVFSG